MRRTDSEPGFTLVELMVVVAITGIIMAAVAVSIRDIARTNSARTMITEVQGEGRTGLYRMQEEIREASLGARTGSIFAVTPAGVEARPAIQIFDNVPGEADWLEVKPGTDAVLVVTAGWRAINVGAAGMTWDAVQASVTEANFDPVGVPLKVTDVFGFAEGQYVLVGSFKSAGWFPVERVDGVAGAPGSLVLKPAANAFPDQRADVGALVRVASSRLYYVDLEDQLVVRELTVPFAPGTEQEVGPPEVIARGVENLQVDCQLDGGGLGYFEGCPAVLPGGNVVAESAASGLANPRLDATTIPVLRTVALSAVFRSRTALADQHGNDPLTVGNEAAPLRPSGKGVADANAEYMRRSYRMVVGVRNTSLGNL